MQPYKHWTVKLITSYNELTVNSHTDAGTFLTLGRKRGDLKNLWTRGVPERPCPHVQDEHSQEFNEEK